MKRKNTDPKKESLSVSIDLLRYWEIFLGNIKADLDAVGHDGADLRTRLALDQIAGRIEKVRAAWSEWHRVLDAPAKRGAKP